MRKFATVILVLAGLVAGCTSGEDRETTTAPADDPRAPGVTADTIRIGITYPDLEAVRRYTTTDHGDYEAAFQALIDEINADGGIHGRTIEPVYEAINAIGTEPAEAACVSLTENEDVFAVIGFMMRDLSLCYVETHETAAVGGDMSPERLERARAPWFGLGHSSDAEADTIRLMAEEGLLDGDLAVYGGPTDAQALDQVLAVLEELGIEPVASGVPSSPPGDTPAQNAATQVIAERFRAADATKVLVVGDGGIPWLQGVESTDYRPQLLVSKRTIIEGWYRDEASGHDLSMLEDAVAGDVFGPNEDVYQLAAMQECFRTQEAAGLEIPDPATIPEGEPIGQFESSRRACETVRLFTAILEEAGPELDYGTFRRAGEGLGDFEMPGSPDPYHFGPGSSLDGDVPVYLYQWDAEERDFIRADS